MDNSLIAERRGRLPVLQAKRSACALTTRRLLTPGSTRFFSDRRCSRSWANLAKLPADGACSRPGRSESMAVSVAERPDLSGAPAIASPAGWQASLARWLPPECSLHSCPTAICPTITRQSGISKGGALSGPKRDVLDRSSEPKRILTRAGARVRDNRDSGGQGCLGLGGWLGDAGTRDIGETRRPRRGCPQVVVSNGFKRRMTGGVNVRHAG